MFEILEKIVKHLAKLDNYYLLKQEKEYIIIGTKIIFKKSKITHPPLSFTPVTVETEIELPIFFVVTVKSLTEKLDMDRFFTANKFPMCSLYKKKIAITSQSVKNLLDDFVRDNFNY
jgi:hypothetical protein